MCTQKYTLGLSAGSQYYSKLPMELTVRTNQEIPW